MALVQLAGDLDGIISRALDKPSERGAALRVMEILPEQLVRPRIQQLARLAAVGHSDIALVRDVITTKIDRRWLADNLDRCVQPILAGAEDEEEFRRIAELYRQLDPGLLKTHLARCASHANEDVREIASDFASEPAE